MGVLGIRTRGRRMVSAGDTTELWRPPQLKVERFLGSLKTCRQNWATIPTEEQRRRLKIFNR